MDRSTALVYIVRTLRVFLLLHFWSFGCLDSEPTFTVQLADLKSNCCEKPQWGHCFQELLLSSSSLVSDLSCTVSYTCHYTCLADVNTDPDLQLNSWLILGLVWQSLDCWLTLVTIKEFICYLCSYAVVLHACCGGVI